MAEKICETCGLNHMDEVQSQALSAATFIKAESVKELLLNSNQPAYAAAIETVIAGWRGHALPTCDPMAIA